MLEREELEIILPYLKEAKDKLMDEHISHVCDRHCYQDGDYQYLIDRDKRLNRELGGVIRKIELELGEV